MKNEKVMESKTWMELSVEELEQLADSITCMYGKEDDGLTPPIV